jgi:Phage tail protein
VTESIKVINSLGQSLVFDTTFQRELALESRGDLGGTGVTMRSQKIPLADGSLYYGSNVDEGDFTFSGILYAEDSYHLGRLRQKVAGVINDALGVMRIIYEKDGVMYELEGVPDGIPSFPSGKSNRTQRFQKATFSFICHNPFWRDAGDRKATMKSFSEAFSMPFRFPIRFGQQGSSMTVFNGGHRPTPILLELSGAATKPRFENRTTGEFLQINRSLASNEKLIINTQVGKKSVMIQKADGTTENAFNYLDSGSTFLNLAIGNNDLRYNAVSSYGNEIAKLTWRQLYNTI